MTTPERRWLEEEIDTLTSMDKIQAMTTPPAPVKRRTMEQDPTPLRPATRVEVEAIEDQILRLAFGKAMRTIKVRTLLMVFMGGLVVGVVGWTAMVVIVLDKAGAP